MVSVLNPQVWLDCVDAVRDAGSEDVGSCSTVASSWPYVLDCMRKTCKNDEVQPLHYSILRDS